MDKPTRRGVIAAMGLTVTAGCSQLSGVVPGGGGSDSPLRGEQIEQISKTFTLKKDQFEPFHLSFDQQSVLLFSAVADENVDVVTLRRPDFKKYKNGSAKQVPFISELSEQNTRATAKGANVTAGKPVIVVDNTTWAKTPPVEEVQIEFELEAFVRADDGG